MKHLSLIITATLICLALLFFADYKIESLESSNAELTQYVDGTMSIAAYDSLILDGEKQIEFIKSEGSGCLVCNGIMLKGCRTRLYELDVQNALLKVRREQFTLFHENDSSIFLIRLGSLILSVILVLYFIGKIMT